MSLLSDTEHDFNKSFMQLALQCEIPVMLIAVTDIYNRAIDEREIQWKIALAKNQGKEPVLLHKHPNGQYYVGTSSRTRQVIYIPFE